MRLQRIIQRSLLLLLLLTCTACGAQAPAEPEQPPAPPDAASSEPVYTNLDSAASSREVRDLLTAAGLEEERIDTVLAWAGDFNDCMRACPSFSLAGEFTALEGGVADYGDYPPASQTWFKTGGRNYHDILCRIAAFQLARPLITVGTDLPREAWACWDEERDWLYSDGDTLFGREASENQKAYAPFPLLDWDEETVQDYFTLFQPIPVAGECGPEEMASAVQETWARRGIVFQEGRYGLLTLWVQSGEQICAAHAAVLAETEEGVLLFEKSNPQAPYTAVKFASAEEAERYLVDMLNLDDARYGMEGRVCVVLRNGEPLARN